MAVNINMNPQIIILEDSEKLIAEAANYFTNLARQSIESRGTFSVALAGGSTPRNCYKLLAEEVFQRQILWENVHLFWGDERNVPPNHIESNYFMVREELLNKITIPIKNIHPFQTDLCPKEAAESYEYELREYFNLQPGQFPEFDLILLGMGTDGHTASLFPNTMALKEEKRLAIENYIEALNAYRLTLTIPLINNARTIIFLVSGDSKAEILNQVLHQPDDSVLYPSQLIQPKSGQLIFLIDRPAAKAFS